MRRAKQSKAPAAPVRFVPSAAGSVAIVSDEPIEVIAQRVLLAARKGGATEAEITAVAIQLRIQGLSVSALQNLQREAAPLVRSSRSSRAALAKNRYKPPPKATDREIRQAMRGAKSLKDVARKLNVSRNTASKYVRKVAQD